MSDEFEARMRELRTIMQNSGLREAPGVLPAGVNSGERAREETAQLWRMQLLNARLLNDLHERLLRLEKP